MLTFDTFAVKRVPRMQEKSVCKRFIIFRYVNFMYGAGTGAFASRDSESTALRRARPHK